MKRMNHEAYQKATRNMTTEALIWTAKDAAETAELQKDFNPNVSYYLDEVCYCGMELERRRQMAAA